MRLKWATLRGRDGHPLATFPAETCLDDCVQWLAEQRLLYGSPVSRPDMLEVWSGPSAVDGSSNVLAIWEMPCL